MQKHAHLALFWAPSQVTTAQTLPLNNFMPTIEAKESPRNMGKLIVAEMLIISPNDHFHPFSRPLEKLSPKTAQKGVP